MPRPGVRTLVAALAVLALIVSVLVAVTGSEFRRDAALGVTRLVLNPTAASDTSVAVTFSAPPVARYSLEVEGPGGHAERIDAHADALSSTGRRWSTVLDGLRPGTEYRYRILVEEASGQGGSTREQPEHGDWHSFTTATAGAADLDFLWFADVQEGLDDAWPELVRDAADAVPDAALSVHTGDLVDLPAEDSEWDAWFAGLGAAASSQLVVPVPGNHDGHGDPTFRAFRSNFTLPQDGPAEETSYVVDYQGVRFVGLDGNRRLQEQADWLDDVLVEDPQPWTVVLLHQPVYSTAMDRSEPLVRGILGPVLQDHDVDLVLHGHDHGYARGYDEDDGTDTPGVTSGPVYVIANAGTKDYAQQPDGNNTWTRRGGVPVVRHGQVTTFQSISVRGCRLEFAAVIGSKRPDATTDLRVGEVLDRFTIDRCSGEKTVTNGEAGGRLR